MRVAFIVAGGFHPGGREQVIPALGWFVERLTRVHEVHVFALRHLDRAQTYRLHGATVHDLGRPGGRWLQWGALRLAMDAAGPFDVVHGYQADPAGLLATLAGKRLRIPSVVTCDSGEFVALPEIDYGLQRSFVRRSIVSLACRWATRVHVTSGYMQRLAREKGVEAVQMPFGVDRDRIRPPAGRPEGPPWRLLQVASLNRVKDQATLLDAIGRVRRSLDVRLDLVGEDTLGGSLQTRAASLGIGGIVTFHGFRPQDELTGLRDAAHLYVQSSIHEAAGVSVLEAAAAGLPVVGTNVGIVNDWGGSAAVAVPPRDAEALAAAIASVLSDRGWRAALATHALALVRQHDADESARSLAALYASLR